MTDVTIKIMLGSKTIQKRSISPTPRIDELMRRSNLSLSNMSSLSTTM